MALPEHLDSRSPLVDVAQQRGSLRARQSVHRVMMVATAVTTAIGVVLLFVARGELWLDEAQTVAISNLPIDGIFSALREDGSPPLYYLILHGWIGLFGDSTATVRALSGVF